MKATAAPIVIFAKMLWVPRGPNAVLETLEGSIGGSGIATPVVGVDYETAAKGRLQTRIRSRQLARAGRLGL